MKKIRIFYVAFFAIMMTMGHQLNAQVVLPLSDEMVNSTHSQISGVLSLNGAIASSTIFITCEDLFGQVVQTKNMQVQQHHVSPTGEAKEIFLFSGLNPETDYVIKINGVAKQIKTKAKNFNNIEISNFSGFKIGNNFYFQVNVSGSSQEFENKMIVLNNAYSVAYDDTCECVSHCHFTYFNPNLTGSAATSQEVTMPENAIITPCVVVIDTSILIDGIYQRDIYLFDYKQNPNGVIESEPIKEEWYPLSILGQFGQMMDPKKGLSTNQLQKNVIYFEKNNHKKIMIPE